MVSFEFGSINQRRSFTKDRPSVIKFIRNHIKASSSLKTDKSNLLFPISSTKIKDAHHLKKLISKGAIKGLSHQGHFLPKGDLEFFSKTSANNYLMKIFSWKEFTGLNGLRNVIEILFQLRINSGNHHS